MWKIRYTSGNLDFPLVRVCIGIDSHVAKQLTAGRVVMALFGMMCVHHPSKHTNTHSSGQSSISFARLVSQCVNHSVACIFFSWQSHAGTAAHAHLLGSLRLITLPPNTYLHSHVTAIPKTRTYTHHSPAQFHMAPITVQLCTFLFTHKSHFCPQP